MAKSRRGWLAGKDSGQVAGYGSLALLGPFRFFDLDAIDGVAQAGG